MSEYPVVTLVLSLIGTITGIIALLISYWTYRKEKPNLEVEALDSSHNFNPTAANNKHINFWLKCRIKNLGDRGTRINDIGLQFKVKKDKISLKAQELNELLPNGNYKVGPKWIDAHDSVIIHANFFQLYEGDEEEKIDCEFTLFHTHGSYSFKTTSERKKIPHM